jgi:hypothetical protein
MNDHRSDQHARRPSDPHADQLSDPHADQLRVIRKLLARAESTDFEAERDACLAKVGELIARYSLEDALQWAEDDSPTRTEPTERVLAVPGPYAARKVILFGSVAAHCGCTLIDLGAGAGAAGAAAASAAAAGGSVTAGGPAGSAASRWVAMIGLPGDLERAEVLATSLLVQLTRAMLVGSPAGRAGSATAAWRRSFIMGFIETVSERLARSAASADAEAATGAGDEPVGAGAAAAASTALVLAGRDDAVAAEVRRRYPRLRTVRIDAGSSPRGRAAGRTAGDRAQLDGGELSRRRRALGT